MLGICWRGIPRSSRPEQHKSHFLWLASSRWHPFCKLVQPHLTANQQAACQVPSRTDSLSTTYGMHPPALVVFLALLITSNARPSLSDCIW